MSAESSRSTESKGDDNNMEFMSTKQEDEEEVLLEPNTSQPLGDPLPRDEHACSVSLPSWASVVGYEEGDEKITSVLRCGYPRFVYHPLILQLMTVVVDRFGATLSSSTANGKSNNNTTEDCLLLPGYAAAVRCQAFLQQAFENSGRKSDNALLCTETGGDDKNTSSSSSSRIRIVPVGAANVYAVLFPAETLAGMQAKAYWQHTGEIVSSRRAEEALKELGFPPKKRVTCGPRAPYVYHPSSFCSSSSSTMSGSTTTSKRSSSKSASASSSADTYSQLRERIAEWAQLPSKDSVFLTPTGMASIYTALRSARRYQLLQSPQSLGGRSIVYGFPYLDTLKLCSRREFCPAGVEFFGLGNEQDLKILEQVLEQHFHTNNSHNNKICALFTEVPSNPLLQCPDLYALRKLADKYDFALIVDDTIGNFLNIDMINTGIADAVCTSLTKIVSGRGDVMAGSIVVNPNTEKGRWMQQDLKKEFYSGLASNDDRVKNDTAMALFESDANAILCNSQDFVERNQRINETSEVLADWLHQHADVEIVYYPKYAPLYPSLLSRPKAGYGGLMSILLESHMCQRTFYDSLNVAKGPSLGTNFTLVCPYTLLAHYHELDFAMSYNVPPNLLRIAVGLEDINVLKSKFEDAFSKSRLYPKLSQSAASSGRQRRAFSTLSSPSQNNTMKNAMASVRNILRRLPR